MSKYPHIQAVFDDGGMEAIMEPSKTHHARFLFLTDKLAKQYAQNGQTVTLVAAQAAPQAATAIELEVAAIVQTLDELSETIMDMGGDMQAISHRYLKMMDAIKQDCYADD